VAEVIRAARPEAEFDVASNPEFLREGAAIDDFMRPDRVVVGIENDRAREVMGDIYRPLFLRDFPIVYTDLESAEMIKYAANAFLATKISFINEIAALCERTGADVKAVAKGMGLDGRIGNKFLHAGPGYGGSCFPKDTSALARIGQEHGMPMRITETVIAVNDMAQAADDRQADGPLRRVGQRQDDRGAGRDLQAQHRRHARGAEPDHRAGAGRRRERRSASSIRRAGARARRCCPA
jgi:UDPglucose 6-dehydrogenase